MKKSKYDKKIEELENEIYGYENMRSYDDMRKERDVLIFIAIFLFITLLYILYDAGSQISDLKSQLSSYESGKIKDSGVAFNFNEQEITFFDETFDKVYSGWETNIPQGQIQRYLLEINSNKNILCIEYNLEDVALIRDYHSHYPLAENETEIPEEYVVSGEKYKVNCFKISAYKEELIIEQKRKIEEQQNVLISLWE